MFMTLPDGTRFRLLPPQQIPLFLMIRAQRVTGIGPVALQARLAANQVRMIELLPLLAEMQQVGSDLIGKGEASDADQDKIRELVNELERRSTTGELDLEAEGVHIWLSRVAAGENELTLEDACKFVLWEAQRELEPEEQEEQKRLMEAAAEQTPTKGAATQNGHARGSARRSPSAKGRSTKT